MSANKHQLSRRSRHSRGTQIAMDMYSLELKRELLEAIPLSEGRTLATSNFDRLYLEARAPDHVGELFMACDKLIRSFVENEKGDVKDAKDFFNRLKNEAFEHQKTLRDNISAAAEYLWTSAQQLNGDSGPEFCSILNKTIRDDDPMDMVHAVLIIRAINMRTVAKRGDDDAAKNTKFRFPKNGICWRGTTFDMKHKDFFRAGVKYRVPGFLATSLQKSTAIMFITRRNDVIHRVLWEIRLDPRGAKQPLYRCQHVHYVHKTHVSGEDEYLFAPYSVFTVAQKPVWNETTSVDPHRIVLVSSLDNKRESVDLPLAPWY